MVNSKQQFVQQQKLIRLHRALSIAALCRTGLVCCRLIHHHISVTVLSIASLYVATSGQGLVVLLYPEWCENGRGSFKLDIGRYPISQ